MRGDRVQETGSVRTGAVPPCGGECYEIVVGKRLGTRSATPFEGFEITDMPDNGSVLRSGVIDQAALHGALSRVRDLGIPLVSVRILPRGRPSHQAE